MSDKLEFSDLYKFVTSVGIAMIGAALALPWAFLREHFDLTLSADAIKGLPPVSQAILERKSHIELFIFRYLPHVSIALLLFGSVIAIIGCYLWLRRQRWRDRAENADTEGKEKTLQAMSKDQIESRAIQELESADSPGNLKELAAQKDTGRPFSLASYVEMEDLVYEKFKKCFSATHSVLRNQRLGAAEFDFILEDKGFGRDDFTIELKVRASNASRSWLLTGIRQAALSAQAYTAATRKYARPILLVILCGGEESAAQLQSRILSLMDDPSLSRVVALAIEERDFRAADCRDIKELLRAF